MRAVFLSAPVLLTMTALAAAQTASAGANDVLRPPAQQMPVVQPQIQQAPHYLGQPAQESVTQQLPAQPAGQSSGQPLGQPSGQSAAPTMVPGTTPATNEAPPNEGGPPLAPLPSPDVAENAKPSDYLRAAQAALALGHNGQTEQALEMAQTRMLDRSVPIGQTDRPDASPIVRQIGQARQALAAGDRMTCMQNIQQALQSATAQGL